eukprot:7773457-Ditylum_brightwellii.AAC.1
MHPCLIALQACHAQDLLKVLGESTKFHLLCAIAGSHKDGAPDPVLRCSADAACKSRTNAAPDGMNNVCAGLY